jgi:hypothetical protein
MMIESRQPGYGFARLEPGDGPRLGRINRACPIEADYRFYFDRGEDFFAWPDRFFASHRYLGIYQGDELVGYGMVGLDRGVIGAGLAPLFYLGDFRILPEHRSFGLGQQAAEVLGSELPDDLRFGYCLVKRGNKTVEWILQTRSAAGWIVSPLCQFSAVNLLLWCWPRRRRGVRRASVSDADALAEVMQRDWRRRLFSPEVTADSVHRDLEELERNGSGGYYLAERGGRIAGALRVWDSHAMRRTVVLGFSRRGELIRLAAAAAARLLPGMATPPGPGQAFRALTLHQVAVPDGDPGVLRDLLLAVLRDHHGQGYHLAHLGFVGSDPLERAVRLLPAQRFDSEIHLIRRRGIDPPELAGTPWIDLARI